MKMFVSDMSHPAVSPWIFELLSWTWIYSPPHGDNQTFYFSYLEMSQPVLPTNFLNLYIGLNQSLLI